MDGIPCHMNLHPSRNVYPIQMVHSIRVVFERQWNVYGPYACPRSYVTQTSTLVRMSTWPAGLFCLFCFWQVVNITQTSTLVWMSTRPVGSFCVCCFWQVFGPNTCLGCHITQTSTLKEFLPDQPVHSVCVSFDRPWNVFGPCKWTASPITQTSTLVGMSTWPAGSVCLCCFWQVVRHLCSLDVSVIQGHMDLPSSSNFCPTSWFILSVLRLTGGETSVVSTNVRDPPSHGPPHM